MTYDAPFPAVPSGDLAVTTVVEIPVALIPYLVGNIQGLTNPELYFGAAQDVIATAEAFDSLLITLSESL